jgi:hypothetical protein
MSLYHLPAIPPSWRTRSAFCFLASKSTLPLCQAREAVGKVLGELKLLNSKDLQCERDYFATPTRSLK